MNNIPKPIFEKNLPNISWEKIYEREYGVQYSEVAVSLFAYAGYHFPKTSVTQVVIPGSGNNTVFYIDAKSWVELVEGLNSKYTAHVKNLEQYEKQFLLDGNNYLKTAKKISLLDLKQFSDKKLLAVFLDHQQKRYRYSTFAWSAFILNNYVADRATKILDEYIQKYKKESKKQEIYNSLFSPHKRAAVLELQYEVQKNHGKLTAKQFDNLYKRFKWLSCLDIHNKPWTKEEFKKHIEPFVSASTKKTIPFENIIKELKFNGKDLEYLFMAKRFVYIKDARDDFRRESVFYSRNLFEELARRMKISSFDTSYLQEQEIIDFLCNKKSVDTKVISQRRKGFIVYLDKKKKLVCVQGNEIVEVLKLFKLFSQEQKVVEISGRVASQGKAKGRVAIIHGIKDLAKVKVGNVFVAVTTHPDFVSAMRKAAAIVTDEGGITSHAAIVSREFGIPCIVGCKNAVKLFKDGDIVEVDAIKGKIVRIEK
ncbi:MAG: PEP-utilizing enzyme [Candidatus Levyibacteriota bacterium]